MTLLLYLEDNCLPLNFPSGSLLSAQETGRAQGKNKMHSFSKINDMMKVANLFYCT